MNDASHRRTVWSRAFIGYLCLLCIFSSFLICVHLSLQEKRLRYVMAELLSEKLRLLRDVSLAHAQVDNLRKLERLQEICEKQLIPLGPPELPALVLPDVLRGNTSQGSIEVDRNSNDSLHPTDLGTIAFADREKADN